MSMKNHMISTRDGVFENLDINDTLNVDGQIILNGQVLNPSGGGSGGGTTVVSCNDNSLVVTQTGGNCLLAYAGQKWSSFPAISDINMNQSSFNNVGQVGFFGGGTIDFNNGVCWSDNNGTNTCYDNNVNIPYISTLLAKNNNASGNSILNLHMVELTNTQITQTGSTGGFLSVSDGFNTGLIYDSHFNQPPSNNSSSSLSTIAFVCNNAVQIYSSSNTSVLWQAVDSANTFGSSPISLGSQGGGQLNIPSFQNNSSSSVVVRVSGYISWDSPNTANSERCVFARKNNVDTDRYGFSNVAVAPGNPCQPFSFDMVLASGDTMQIIVFHNDNATTHIHSSTSPGSRIIITTLSS